MVRVTKDTCSSSMELYKQADILLPFRYIQPTMLLDGANHNQGGCFLLRFASLHTNPLWKYAIDTHGHTLTSFLGIST